MKIIIFIALLSLNISAQDISNSENDHEKAIKAVTEGEILTLDQILQEINISY